MYVDLTDKDITALQKSTEDNMNSSNPSKRNSNGHLKDTTEGNKCIVFHAFDISPKRIGF